MGGMAAMKLAAAQPSRITSLTVISSTGGGWEAIPSTWRAIRYAWMVRHTLPLSAFRILVMIYMQRQHRDPFGEFVQQNDYAADGPDRRLHRLMGLTAACECALQGLRANTPQKRAKVDLKFHFTKSTLMQNVSCVAHRVCSLVVSAERFCARCLEHVQVTPGHAGGCAGEQQADRAYAHTEGSAARGILQRHQGRGPWLGPAGACHEGVRTPQLELVPTTCQKAAHSVAPSTCGRVSYELCGTTRCGPRTTKPSGRATSRVRCASGGTRMSPGVALSPEAGNGSPRCVRASPLQVIHGRHDIVAPPKYGERLAGRMGCPCIILEGAHFLTRERGPAINALLRHIIMPDAVKVRRDVAMKDEPARPCHDLLSWAERNCPARGKL